MRKTHDADLCERIRLLEERVKELEARPAPHYCYFGCPHHYWYYWGTNTVPQWTYTVDSSASMTGSVVTNATVPQ